MADPKVVVLAGGTGGAKLARGLYAICGERLTVVANTGDDIEIYGAHVSPDPDLCLFWLADEIDDRGWGLRGDTFTEMDALRDRGEDVWFNLGDRDLALCRERLARLSAGERLTEIHASMGARFGVTAPVLPMSDQPVRTEVVSGTRTLSLQEFLIAERGAGPIDDIVYAGAARAEPSGEVLEALASADVIVIGPSNPILSIGPILALSGMREALRGAGAPVVAVSPVVGGSILKGPTAACMAWAGRSVDAAGIASHYGEVIDGLVSDEPATQQMGPHLHTDTTLTDAGDRRRVATSTLEFALSLR